MAARVSSVDLSELLAAGNAGAPASAEAVRAYVAARARAAAVTASAQAEQAARAAEMEAWAARIGGPLSRLLRDAAEAHAASASSPLAAPRAHSEAVLSQARAEARRLLAAAAAAADEAEPLPLPVHVSPPDGRGAARSLSPATRAAPLLPLRPTARRSLPPARPPWERWTSPARARRGASEPPATQRRSRSVGRGAVTPVRLAWADDDHGRPAQHSASVRYSAYSDAATPPVFLGSTSAERAAAVMSVRRAARAAAARARAEELADTRGL